MKGALDGCGWEGGTRTKPAEWNGDARESLGHVVSLVSTSVEACNPSNMLILSVLSYCSVYVLCVLSSVSSKDVWKCIQKGNEHPLKAFQS